MITLLACGYKTLLILWEKNIEERCIGWQKMACGLNWNWCRAFDTGIFFLLSLAVHFQTHTHTLSLARGPTNTVWASTQLHCCGLEVFLLLFWSFLLSLSCCVPPDSFTDVFWSFVVTVLLCCLILTQRGPNHEVKCFRWRRNTGCPGFSKMGGFFCQLYNWSDSRFACRHTCDFCPWLHVKGEKVHGVVAFWQQMLLLSELKVFSFLILKPISSFPSVGTLCHSVKKGQNEWLTWRTVHETRRFVDSILMVFVWWADTTIIYTTGFPTLPWWPRNWIFPSKAGL